MANVDNVGERIKYHSKSKDNESKRTCGFVNILSIITQNSYNIV